MQGLPPTVKTISATWTQARVDNVYGQPRAGRDQSYPVDQGPWLHMASGCFELSLQAHSEASGVQGAAPCHTASAEPLPSQLGSVFAAEAIDDPRLDVCPFWHWLSMLNTLFGCFSAGHGPT